jgi:hypothetical protein
MSKGTTGQVFSGSYSSLDASQRAEIKEIWSIGLNEAVIDSVLSSEAAAPLQSISHSGKFQPSSTNIQINSNFQ